MIGGAKGIGIGLDFGIGNQSRPKGSGKYLDPAVKEALCGIWIADQNTNESPTRNIIKNKLKNKGGDFEIFNTAYKLNSGYGKYNYDYTTFSINKNLVKIINSNKIEYFFVAGGVGAYTTKTNTYTGKIKITGLSASIQLGKVDRFQIYGSGGTPIIIREDGVYDINTTYETNVVYMYVVPKGGYFGSLDSPIYIEQIPDYQGAFCTDGVDDLIVSQKPVSEMLEGSNEITVVSMIHQIMPRLNSNDALNNQIRPALDSYIRSNITTIDKTGIYGYTILNLDNPLYNSKVINNILGDKNDYKFNSTINTRIDGKLSVEGFITNEGNIDEVSQVAWYWTLIAKRVLTTDEINQVIAYYNLDKYVAPDIYYDVKKQGLTNENHTEFGDKLIDYSGNGKDMQLYNFGWKLDSGVGKYEEDFTSWSKYSNVLVNSNKITVAPNFNSNWFIYKRAKNYAINSIIVNITGIPKRGTLRYYYSESTTSNQKGFDIISDGIYTLPQSVINNTDFAIGFGIPFEGYDWTNIVIEQLPSFEGALVFNGVNDYGQYVGDLGLKDYTVVTDRAYVKYTNNQVPISSSVNENTATPFLLEFGNSLSYIPFSFSESTNISVTPKINRKIVYQSSYIYDSYIISKGTNTNTGQGLTFGKFGNAQQYAKLCLYNFMLFPYSLSEFLINRQLKKRKLGTLYPGMIEFRPVINADMRTILDISFKLNDSQTISAGEYIPINSGVSIRIDLKKYQLDEVSLLKVNGETIQMNKLGNYWQGIFTVIKSSQKIDITVDEYIRYESIVQPYPFIPNLYFDKERTKIITYGDKLKVGSTIHGHFDTNLLPELYTHNRITYKGITVNNLPIVVEKQMAFDVISKNYLKDNEPKCILSPEILEIPNKSYEYLGYIPDISGHNNHGYLNNVSYTKGSGTNYKLFPVSVSKFEFDSYECQGKTSEISFNGNKITITQDVFEGHGYGSFIYSSDKPSVNRIKISGINNTENTIYIYSGREEYRINKDGIYDYNIKLSSLKLTGGGDFSFDGDSYYSYSENLNITIELFAKEEDITCFALDGINDFIKLNDLISGGKQMFMKLSFDSNGTFAYDQRVDSDGDSYAMYVGGDTIAYNYRNTGDTFINGVLNKNVLAGDFNNIIHNVTMTCYDAIDSTTPVIGANANGLTSFTKMSLYTFMLFDEISTPEKIKELNEIIGINPMIETSPYYYDAYGKTNIDADKNVEEPI